MNCRRCCWWRIDHPDGRVEQPHREFASWLDYGDVEVGVPRTTASRIAARRATANVL